jgi:ABC-type maltose transport system permease subunit
MRNRSIPGADREELSNLVLTYYKDTFGFSRSRASSKKCATIPGTVRIGLVVAFVLPLVKPMIAAVSPIHTNPRK